MSCADVCIDMGYDDDNEFYAESTPKARTAHVCEECRETIQPGDVYQRVAGKSDGRIWTVTSCANCCAIRKALVCGTWIFGELWTHIEEGVFPAWLVESPLDCLAKVEPLSARTMLRERFAEWKAEQ